MILLAFLLLVVPPETKEPPRVLDAPDARDLNGVYQSRTEDNGKIHHGAVTIQRRRDLYFVHWLTQGTHTKGFGIRQGDALSVHWWIGDGDKHIKGCTHYKITGDKLVGKWGALPSDGRLQRETLFFLKALPALPEPAEDEP